jgi:hypothetical protein
MSKFDHIRPFYDSEVNEAITGVVNHPMMKALMSFTFPDVEEEVWANQLLKTHSKQSSRCFKKVLTDLPLQVSRNLTSIRHTFIYLTTGISSLIHHSSMCRFTTMGLS